MYILLLIKYSKLVKQLKAFNLNYVFYKETLAAGTHGKIQGFTS